jgi:protein-disulfide isomerase
MGIRVLSAVFVGLFALADTTCGKSTTDDPTKDKGGPDVPIVTLDGVDTASMTTREKKEFSTYVTDFLSPCPNVPVSLAQCVKEKRDCSKCVPGAKIVAKGVKDGMSREQIEKSYKNRFDPAAVKNVPIDGSPTIGPESATVTLVEYADFQCPHCAEFAPMLDKLVEENKDVRFVYKFYILGKVPHSELAARAAIAAWRQGKFWEMHHLIFANQSQLDQERLDAIAKQLGLDVSRLHADMQANETTERIAQDRKLGETLKIEGTPTLFINGRQYDGRQDIRVWIALERELACGTKPAPAPAGPTDAGKSDARK